MTDRVPTPASTVVRPVHELVGAPVRLDIEPEVLADLASRARGRRLLIDWFSTRCCTNIAVGDVTFRWRAAGEAIESDACLVATVGGLELWIQAELVPLFERARARVVLRGVGPWRHPAVVAEDVTAWFEFFASCPTRSVWARGPRDPS